MISHESRMQAGSVSRHGPILGRMVNPGENCCAQVQAIQTMWYPELRSPKLPLKDCEKGAACTCAWRFVRDRRVGQRRAFSDDARGELEFEGNASRRTQRDRRRDTLMGYQGGALLS